MKLETLVQDVKEKVTSEDRRIIFLKSLTYFSLLISGILMWLVNLTFIKGIDLRTSYLAGISSVFIIRSDYFNFDVPDFNKTGN